MIFISCAEKSHMEFAESDCFLSIISSINVKSSPARFLKVINVKLLLLLE